MSIAEIAQIAAIIITAIIWGGTQYLNRKHEVFKVRLNKRVEIFGAMFISLADWVSLLDDYNTCRKERVQTSALR